MYDVVIVGAGIAGLSAGLILGRANRSVLILDGGAPRNEPAEHSHGLFTRDGTPPLELLDMGRHELETYPNVEVRRAAIASASGESGAFKLTLDGGEPIDARKIVLATGVKDVLPDVPGVEELWGKGIYHCPFCHGWEVRSKTWALLGDGSLVFERAVLFASWTSDLIVLGNGLSELSADDKERLSALGVAHDDRRISRIERAGESDVALLFEDGSTVVVGGVFIVPKQTQRSGLAESLGCEIEDFEPTSSQYVKVNAQMGATTVSGVYAAGDMIGPQQSLILASASGARVGYALTNALTIEDAEARVAKRSAA